MILNQSINKNNILLCERSFTCGKPLTFSSCQNISITFHVRLKFYIEHTDFVLNVSILLIVHFLYHFHAKNLILYCNEKVTVGS